MKILFATTNEAKIKSFKASLEKENIEVLSIKDLDFKLDIDENGADAIENARIKARAYYAKTGIPTIGMDNTLFIEELPPELQPGTHVRRINNRELNDDEMLDYYTNLVANFGGKLTAKWVYGLVYCDDTKEETFTWSKDHFYFVANPCSKRNPGYPLDSISFMPKYNKYFLELNEEEKNDYDKNNNNTKDIVNFIKNNLRK